MTKTISFNDLRRIKDQLPPGASQMIADKLGFSVERVRNYFGGQHYQGKSDVSGIHYEPGPDGGSVLLDNTLILETALEIIEKEKAGK